MTWMVNVYSRDPRTLVHHREVSTEGTAVMVGHGFRRQFPGHDIERNRKLFDFGFVRANVVPLSVPDTTLFDKAVSETDWERRAALRDLRTAATAPKDQGTVHADVIGPKERDAAIKAEISGANEPEFAGAGGAEFALEDVTNGEPSSAEVLADEIHDPWAKDPTSPRVDPTVDHLAPWQEDVAADLVVTLERRQEIAAKYAAFTVPELRKRATALKIPGIWRKQRATVLELIIDAEVAQDSQ